MIRHEHRTILGPIPDDWDARPVRSLLTESISGDWGDDAGDVTRAVLRSTNFDDSGNLDEADVAMRGFSSAAAQAIQVQQGDILLERSGGGPDRPVGRVVNIRKEMTNTGFANFIQCLRPDPNEVVPEFLHWALYQLHRCGQVARIQHQTTQMRNLDLRDYHRVVLPYPEPDEQKRIAAVLTAADDHIRALAEQLRQAERLRTALVEQCTSTGIAPCESTKVVPRFRHNFYVNSLWDVIELRELKPQIDYGTNEASNDYASGVPVIAIPQVLSFRFSLGSLPHADLSEQETRALALQAHDVLLIRTNGNPSYIGKSTVIPEGVLRETTIFASYLIRIRVNSRLRGAFLNYVLRSAFGRRQSNCLANTSAGNFNLGARALSKFLIPLPPPDVQDEIVQAIDAADDLVLNLEEQMTAARRVKQSLLQNLLTGKVRLRP
jgi:type I restriction enzyme S subunit